MSKIYRLLEIVPGGLVWLTFAAMFLLSWKAPVVVAVFIILFDIYWLLKTIYLYFHLKVTFSKARKNLKINWLEKLNGSGLKWKDIYHLIILPMYKEPYEVVKETFGSIVSCNYPKDKFIVVLATEERAGDSAKRTADMVKKEFSNSFFKFITTCHPANLPGEIPGKGSNESWAAEKAKCLIIDKLGIEYENILTSVFDIDTQVPKEYFGRLTYVFLNSKNRLRAVYQPIPLFINNIFESPALARVVSFSSTFWQMVQQSREEHLTTFSSQSVPFKVVVDIGFWEKDVVAEDSRIFWQGFIHYHGDFRVVPLNFPVSMDANSAPSFWQTMKNLYKQQRRWAWGCEDIPYLLYWFAKDKLIPFRKKILRAFDVIEGFHSWATNSIMIFALGWLPLALGGEKFNYSVLSYNLPQITSFIVQLSMFGVATSAILSVLLLPPKPKWFRFWHYILYILQWLLLPVTLIIFGAFPAIDAETRLMLGGKFRLGFWVTPKGRYEKQNRA